MLLFMGKNTPNRQKFIIENLRAAGRMDGSMSEQEHHDDERDERDDEFAGEEGQATPGRWSG